MVPGWVSSLVLVHLPSVYLRRRLTTPEMTRETSYPQSSQACHSQGYTAYLVCLVQFPISPGTQTDPYRFLTARHDVYTAARTAKLGMKLSFTYGILQDALETLKGNQPAYIDFITGNRRSKAAKEGSI